MLAEPLPWQTQKYNLLATSLNQYHALPSCEGLRGEPVKIRVVGFDIKRYDVYNKEIAKNRKI
jgi:hypothetical protein